MLEKLLKTSAVADLLRVDPSTLEAWRSERIGPAVVVLGRREVRYRPADLRAWLATCSQRSTWSTEATSSAAVDLDRLLVPAEVASLLGLAVGTLENWRTKGRGPDYLKLAGRIVRYRPSDVSRYIEGRVTRPAPSPP